MEKWFLYNKNWIQGSPQDFIPADCNRIYEVLRVMEGKPLFLEDHYERFVKSLEEVEQINPIQFLHIETSLAEVLKRNYTDVCNIRFELILEYSNATFAVYEVPFRYPDDKDYEKGVKVSSFLVERNNPHVKQTEVNNKIRKTLKTIYDKENVFEVLLIDHYGNITEGSRSNVFFVRDNVLYSAPSEQILEGITRKKVLQLANDKGIKFIEKPISFDEIHFFDACFLTGTSPKILPVSTLNNISYSADNILIKALMKEYNILIKQYISES
jgi:branched-chain amino acid aminotransferase